MTHTQKKKERENEVVVALEQSREIERERTFISSFNGSSREGQRAWPKLLVAKFHDFLSQFQNRILPIWDLLALFRQSRPFKIRLSPSFLAQSGDPNSMHLYSISYYFKAYHWRKSLTINNIFGQGELHQ